MSRHFALFACSCALALGSLGSLATPAHASMFDVSPINLTLSGKATTGMLSVTNRGTEALRFQISAFAWDESPKGEMILHPTRDIVFFPAMLTVNPGEARKLRVGMNVKPAAKEKSYRIFVQELPPLVKGPDDANAVRVLTKMGIPVFIAPEAPKLTAQLAGLSLRGAKLDFAVRNPGNVHFRPETIVVTARDGGKVLHTEETPGWYVLAGGVRNYSVELPAQACSALNSVQVELRMEKGGTKATLASARCTP